MRKLLPILLLAVLFISCSSDDDNDPNNGNQNGKDMIDEKILGKWKVEYSKIITPAKYNETTGVPEYNDSAEIVEYNGDYNGSSNLPKAGMFGGNDYSINIKNDNYITVSEITSSTTSKDVKYTIESGKLVTGGYWTGNNNTGTYIPKQYHKYSLNNNTLTIEFIGIEDNYTWTPYYKISKYSKITE